jgi:hypothetical protein
MEAYASLVNQRTSHLKHAFGFVDGVKFNVHAPTNADEQVAFYNGWKCGCFVSAILVFSPDGTIIYANYNCPGSRHDAFNAQELFSILLDDNLTPQPYFIVGDSAFPRRGCMEGRILTSPSASDLPSYFPSFAQASAAYLVSKSVVYVRQSAEWGMRGLQGSFSILHHCLPSDHHYRGAMIKASLHLMNFKTRTGGANQITEVFRDSRDVALERLTRAAACFQTDPSFYLAEFSLCEQLSRGDQQAPSAPP